MLQTLVGDLGIIRWLLEAGEDLVAFVVFVAESKIEDRTTEVIEMALRKRQTENFLIDRSHGTARASSEGR